MRVSSVLSIAAVLLAVTTAHAQTLEALSFDQKLRLAKAGDEKAQIAIARAYEKGAEVAADKAEAANWYRKAADEGNAEAMFGLARILSKGAPGVEKSPELAAKLYEAAARQGHVEAQNWLGYCYEHGLGIQQSDAAAVEWYTKAADKGLAAAQNNLGLMYLTGKGVSRDFGKASALFEQAADGGDVWGANNLGGLYEMGWGVEADQQKALAYYSQASEKGNKHAGENFRRLSAVLGSSAIGPRVEQSNTSDPAVLTKAKVGSAPPQSNGQASSAVEPAPAPKHKKATDFRAGTKKQTRAGQLPAAKNSTQRTSKESATCGLSLFKDLFGLHLCD